MHQNVRMFRMGVIDRLATFLMSSINPMGRMVYFFNKGGWLEKRLWLTYIFWIFGVTPGRMNTPLKDIVPEVVLKPLAIS